MARAHHCDKEALGLALRQVDRQRGSTAHRGGASTTLRQGVGNASHYDRSTGSVVRQHTEQERRTNGALTG